MSRVIVKNLPKRIDISRFKEHFSSLGVITDAKLIFKGDEFRRFGFIGFENPKSAEEAVQQYNGAYIAQQKISVEVTHGLGYEKQSEAAGDGADEQEELHNNGDPLDESATRRPATSSSLRRETLTQLGLYESVSKALKDPKFRDFLKVNHCEHLLDELLITTECESEDDTASGRTGSPKKKNLAHKKELSDLDYLKSLVKKGSGSADAEVPLVKKVKNKKGLYRVVVRSREMCSTGDTSKGRKQFFNKKSVKDFFLPVKCKSISVSAHGRLVAYVGFASEYDREISLKKNNTFLKGARVQVKKLNDSVPSKCIKKSASWLKKEEDLKEKAPPIAESGEIFIRNLAYSTTEDEVRELFEKYGSVSDVRLPLCKATRKSKGFAVVTFLFPENGIKAVNELDGSIFKGRLLHILPSLEAKQKEGSENLSYEIKKEQELKNSSSSWHNWNTLFLGSDAVVNLMQEKYGVSKREILSTEQSQSAAVNLALGESQLVDETKRFLEGHGVCLASFTNPSVKRSRTVVLVKNLPEHTKAKELYLLFSKFGELGRVVLPPSGITGIVEYLDAGEARRGYRMLAYSKFKNMPLYLEWAPAEIFKDSSMQQVDGETGEPKTGGHVEGEGQSENDKQVEVKTQTGTTLFVSNLVKTTTEENLKEHFEVCGPVLCAVVTKRKGVSQGYGFVQFLKREDAKKALVELNHSYLHDNCITLKLSEKILKSSVKVTERKVEEFGNQLSAKILIKNIPFQATTEEVRQLFRTFGEIKSVRLPKKVNSDTHRGFGFVEFTTRQEAKQAFEALSSSTHMYGRRLVLRWAVDEESVEELRKKTASQFLEGNLQKKHKLSLLGEDERPVDMTESLAWN